jgi:hypothetical protein
MIEKTININLIKNKKIVVATPMFGGQAHVGYIQSIINLTEIASKHDIQISYLFRWNESLITRARNHIVDEFLKGDSDYLFFIDADISFNPLDFLYMIQLAEKDKEKQIICGAYPHKLINWDFIHEANKKELIKNKEEYLFYQSKYVLNISEKDKNESILFNLEEPLKVHQSGTGFMLIAREVFNKFTKNYPEQKYIDQDSKTEKIAFFDCKINPETNFYMSEDWMFCYYASKMSISTWILPWVSLSHFGTYEYKGDFVQFSLGLKEINS